MKISIVTPVYNAEKTIERTILSVIEQQSNLDSSLEIEYIIIDGASKDKTLEIINRYANKINIIISEKDQGVYYAMNKGILLATGDIIGIINADDWYNDNALSTVKKAFQQHPEVSIVHSPVKNYVGEKYISTFMPGTIEAMPFKMTVAHPSCFVKKDVYDRIGLFDLSYRMAADYDFILRACGEKYKFHCVDLPLASFSLNGMTGKLLNRLHLIKESWRTTADYVDKYQSELRNVHRIFYIKRYWTELLLTPVKYIDPHAVIRTKRFLRKYFGKLSSDKYGAW